MTTTKTPATRYYFADLNATDAEALAAWHHATTRDASAIRKALAVNPAVRAGVERDAVRVVEVASHDPRWAPAREVSASDGLGAAGRGALVAVRVEPPLRILTPVEALAL